jgi:putative permease
MTKSKREKTLQNVGILALVLVSLYYLNELFGPQIDTLLRAANSILLPFGIALFISYLLSPIVNFIETKLKVKQRYLSIAIVFVLMILVAALFVLIIGSIIYNQAESFFNVDWENILTTIENYVAQNEFLQDGYAQISEYLTFDSAAPVIFDVFGVLQSMVSIIIAIVLVPVFLVFLLSEKNRIFNGLLTLLPKKYQKEVAELGIRANDVTEKYFNGRFLSMFIMSIFFTIVFWIFGFGLDKAIFFGFTLGFLDLIPYVGGFIGIALPVLYSFTITGDVLFGQWAFIALIIINMIAQFLQGNVLQPYIMGKEVNLHPLLILSSFIFFGALFGITGIILAIPITGTLKTTLDYYREERHG